MAQQTAVEWFYQRILAKDIKEVYEQAKQKEKDQILDAFDSGLAYDYDEAETYYNKTYTK